MCFKSYGVKSMVGNGPVAASVLKERAPWILNLYASGSSRLFFRKVHVRCDSICFMFCLVLKDFARTLALYCTLTLLFLGLGRLWKLRKGKVSTFSRLPDLRPWS